MKLAFVLAVCVFLLVTSSQAEISNGSFDSSLTTGWDGGSTGGDANIAILGSHGGFTNVLHMSSTTSYVWDSDAEAWEITSDIGRASLMQFSIVVPNGATALTFDASAFCANATKVGSLSGMNPSALVSINYIKDGQSDDGIESVWMDVADSGLLTSYSIPISPDAGSLADISIAITSRLDTREPNDLNLDAVDVGINAYFDNFTFAVPEPCTLSLLAAGALAAMRRRRAQ